MPRFILHSISYLCLNLSASNYMRNILFWRSRINFWDYMSNYKSCFSESFDRLMHNCVVIWIKRVMPLLTSLWMEVDMALDVRQTLIYYDHAFNPNGTYASWALEYIKTTTGTMETVHPGYFYTSIVVWVLPTSHVFGFWVCVQSL